MTVKEFYDSIGGDYDTVFSQLLKDERIAKFAKRFVEDPTYSQLIVSLNNKDYDTAFRMAHTLKGVAALLDKKDHSTVLHGYNKITEEIKKDPEFRETIEAIKNKIKSL